MDLPLAAVRPIIANALDEDIGWGDITTRALVPPDHQAEAKAIVKGDGILAGIDIFALTFTAFDPSLSVKPHAQDGTRIKPGDIVATVKGNAASILTAERVALNFVQRLSGIATLTARFVEVTQDLPVRIMETRKTTPGLRLLEKYAVRVGGGSNHRYNLSDGVLVKDNHLAILRSQGVTMKQAIALVRQKVPLTLKIEVEVETVAEAQEAAAAGADIILLDNMDVETMREAIAIIGGRASTEASGGVTLEKVRHIALTGVNFISAGALTHSFKALDISLEMEI